MVCAFQNDIKDLHYAAVTGDTDLVGHREFRQQVYLAKDKNGLSAFHKAIGNGHKEMAEHLIEKTDRGVVNQVNIIFILYRSTVICYHIPVRT